MSRFVDIAPTGKPPYQIDADDVAMVTASGPEKDIALHSRQGGTCLAHFPVGHNTRDVIARLRAAGISLVALKEKYDDPNPHPDRSVVLFNPAALASVVVSDLLVRSGDPHKRIIVKLDGAETEVLNISPEEEKNILCDIARLKLPLTRIDAAEAQTYFHEPGYAMIDPAKIARVTVMMHEIKVKFLTAPFDLSFTKSLPAGKNLQDLSADRNLRDSYILSLKLVAQKLVQGQKEMQNLVGAESHLDVYLRPHDLRRAMVDSQNPRQVNFEFRAAAGGTNLIVTFREEKYVTHALSSLNPRPA